MTTPTSSSRPLRLTDIGDLIAAVPALLGFRPARSLVVLSLSPVTTRPGETGAATIGAVMRHDLLLDGPRDGTQDPMREAFRRFRAVCAREEADSVIAILVDDRLQDPHGPAAGRAHALLEEFAAYLATADIVLGGALAVPAIDAGATWFVPGRDDSGTVPDPDASVVAATRVFDGNPIRRTRSELTTLLEPSPASFRADVASRLDAAVDARDLAYERAERSGGSAAADRAELETLLALVLPGRDGEHLLPGECAELAVILANRTVRDAALALATGPWAGAAERLWVDLVRALPDPERADAAALVAFGAYVRGDGPFAGVALGVALESDPRHRLSDLLDQALQAGLRPDAIRSLAATGYEIAARLGVALPQDGPAR
ncbi:MAG: DUF4192 domain-containing protein [Rhodococcus sp. (in: high G+C Gram-positive bacteria)]|uniref:DUF4192 domain-containing protein n=1 Tax=Rhodococcus sp. TaxID=1831 RepID=UPI003D9B1EE3